MQEVVLRGITKADIQKILEDTIKQFHTLPKIYYIDTSYLYTFHLADVYYINKFTDLLRISGRKIEGTFRNPLAIQWHEWLEQWFAGETVKVFEHPVKPIAITRTLDRVPNEGLEALAGGFTATSIFEPQKFHAIGDGAIAGTNPSPSATGLVAEVDRIDVSTDPGGGGLTRNGSTIFVIGNHDIFTPSMSATETGVFDSMSTTSDLMGDYSIFPDEIDHNSGQDAPGSTTVIYQCST
jgi:hypothetical protein